MMENDKDKSQSTAATEQRRRADELITGAEPPHTHLNRTEDETLRLVHELQVHQIELEMQNAELRQARDEVETALDKYTDLYDFAPVGYFTLDRDGAISAVNLSGASLLGGERSRLIGQRFGLFVAAGDRPAFTTFLGTVFASRGKEACEVTILNKENQPLIALIEAIAAASGHECRISLIDIAALKQAGETLRAMNAYNRSLIEASLDPLVTIGTDGKITDVNAATETATGYSHNELIGTDFFDYVTEPQKAMAGYRQVLRQGAVQDYELEIRHRDGHVTPVLFNATVFRSEAGEVEGVFAAARDITERKRMEQERETLLRWEESVNLLQQSLLAPATQDQKLKSITDSIVRIFDADFCRIWLIRPGDLCEQGCIHALEQDGEHVCRYRERCLHLLASSGRYIHTDGKVHRRVPFGCYKIGHIASGEEHKFLTNDVTSDPRVHNHDWARNLGLVSFAGYQLRVPDGWTIGVLALFAKHPISADEDAMLDGLSNTAALVIQQAAAETALQKSEEFVKIILETVDEGFIVVDREYRIISANKAFCNSANLNAEQVLGRTCHEISHHVKKPCFENSAECPVRRVFKTGKPCNASHTHLLHGSDKRYVEIKAFPVRDAAGNVVSAIETINDVTEKTHLEGQLRHAQKLESLGTLAGGVAHDFNNILSVMVGYGSLIEMRMPKDDPNTPYIREILAAADRATSLTQALLIFSRKQLTETKKVSINELIEGMRKMVLRLIGEDIDTNISLFSGNLMVMGDYGHLEQVLMNLATNARDAMPDGGSLSIKTELHEIDGEFIDIHGFGKPGNYALISVSDTGEGMDAKTRERIFEPFFTTKGVGKGTGLGLAIVYGIVKQHHGFINCYSEPGRGTTFKVYLPVVREEELDVEEVVAGPVTGGNETILIADDDENIRRLTIELLERYGYTVIEARDGADAVDKFIDHKERINLVLLDVIMPQKSGREAFEEIRDIRPDVKILFISGYTEDIIQRKRIMEDKLPLLQKPAKPKELLSRIREILDGK